MIDARGKALDIVEQACATLLFKEGASLTSLILDISRALVAFAAERERAMWEVAAKIAEQSNGDCDCGRAYGDCDIGNDVAAALRAQADNVKYLPHAGTLISRAEAKRISEDGP